MNSLHGLLNCEIGGLDCHVITTEYRTHVHCIHSYNLVCNALVHVKKLIVACGYTIQFCGIWVYHTILWPMGIPFNTVAYGYTIQLCGLWVYHTIMWPMGIPYNSVAYGYTIQYCGLWVYHTILWPMGIPYNSVAYGYTNIQNV